MDDGVRARLCASWSDRLLSELGSAAEMEALSTSLPASEADLARQLRVAATDERRHGELCAEVLSMLGGCRPAVEVRYSLPPVLSADPQVHLAEQVIYLLVAGEQIATTLLHQAASGALPAVAAILDRIAADEERHGVLGWRVLDALVAAMSPAQRAELKVHAPRQATRAVLAVGAVGAGRPEPRDAESSWWGIPEPVASRELALQCLVRQVAPALASRDLWSQPSARAGG